MKNVSREKNIALHKKILEKNCETPEQMTDGDCENYTLKKGFCQTLCPNDLTIDLETIYDIGCIRFLLFDNCGCGKRERSSRRYLYRLLTSIDGKSWNVLFDTCRDGYNGWQEFHFIPRKKMRYIRIHALNNTRNEYFHIVQLEAYENENMTFNEMPALKISINDILRKNEKKDESGYLIAKEIKKLAKEFNEILEICQSKQSINKKDFEDILFDLQKLINEAKAIEEGAVELRQQLMNKIKKQLNQAHQNAIVTMFSCLVGFISLYLSICTTPPNNSTLSKIFFGIFVISLMINNYSLIIKLFSSIYKRIVPRQKT